MDSAQAHERIGAQGSGSEELLAWLGLEQAELRDVPGTAWGFANTLTSTACHVLCCMCVHEQVNISLFLLICWSAGLPQLGLLFHPTSHFKIACSMYVSITSLSLGAFFSVTPRNTFQNRGTPATLLSWSFQKQGEHGESSVFPGTGNARPGLQSTLSSLGSPLGPERWRSGHPPPPTLSDFILCRVSHEK